MMLRHATGFSQEKLLACHSDEVERTDAGKLNRILARRAKREPLAYILGEKEFYGLNFAVDPRVLIPRPETEMLVDLCIDFCREYRLTSPDICDIGTGSGIIAITLAKHLPNAKITGTDISEDALEIAKLNANKHDAKLDFAVSDATQSTQCARFDVIVSNPPYIRSDAISSLEPEIREWEPRQALDGGADGMKVLQPLIRSLPSLWRAHAPSATFIEIDPPVSDLCVAAAHAVVRDGNIDVHRDFAGLERVLVVVRG